MEAIKGERTVNEIASARQVHPNQVTAWRKQVLSGLPEAFSQGRPPKNDEEARLVERLYEQIGWLKVELDWPKKRQVLEACDRRPMVEPGRRRLSLARQRELLGLSHSTFYCEPSAPDDLNLLFMRLIDEQYTRNPFYGSPKMTH